MICPNIACCRSSDQIVVPHWKTVFMNGMGELQVVLAVTPPDAALPGAAAVSDPASGLTVEEWIAAAGSVRLSFDVLN